MIIFEDGKNYKLTMKAIFSDNFYETILTFRSDVCGFVDDKFGALYRLDNKRILKIEEVE